MGADLRAYVDDIERLYREHGDRLWWAVLAFAGDREVANDAVAELAALGRLSPKQRAAVVLHYYGGYRLKEVAQLIGGTAGTVGVHLSRARKRLRIVLAEEAEGRHG